MTAPALAGVETLQRSVFKRKRPKRKRRLGRQMTDILKEILAAFQHRVRSPVAGFVLLAVLTINWKIFAYLVFSGHSITARFRYFDENFSWVYFVIYPIFLGTTFALAYPWLNYGFTWSIAAPVRRLRFLQEDERRKSRIHALLMAAEEDDAKARADEARERLSIDRAKRLQEARDLSKEAGNNDLVFELEEKRKAESEESLSKNVTLSDGELYVLREAAKVSSGRFSFRDLDNSYAVAWGNQQQRIEDRREYLNLLHSADALKKKAMVSTRGEMHYEVTKQGYDYLRNL